MSGQDANCLKAFLKDGVMFNNVVDTIVEIQRPCVPIHFTKDGMEIAFRESNMSNAGVNLVIPANFFSSYHLQPVDAMYSIGVYLTRLQKLLHFCTHDQMLSFMMFKNDNANWYLNRDDEAAGLFHAYRLPNVDIDFDIERSLQHESSFHIRIGSSKLKSIMQEFLKHNPSYVKVYMNHDLVQFKIDSCDDQMEGSVVIENHPRACESGGVKLEKNRKRKRIVVEGGEPADDDPLMALSAQCTEEEEAMCQIQDAYEAAGQPVQRCKMQEWKRQNVVDKIVERKEVMQHMLHDLVNNENTSHVCFQRLYIKSIIKMCSLNPIVEMYIKNKQFIMFKVVLTNDINASLYSDSEPSATLGPNKDETNIPILQLVFNHAIDPAEMSEANGTDNFAAVRLDDCDEDDD
jgi:hypothetical protein